MTTHDDPAMVLDPKNAHRSREELWFRKMDAKIKGHGKYGK